MDLVTFDNNDDSESSMNGSKSPPTLSVETVSRGRAQVALRRGRSPIDWLRFMATLPDRLPRSITTAELNKHNTRSDCWVALHGVVFDVTDYLEYHPGGIKILKDMGGKDCSSLFDKYHAWVTPETTLNKFVIGPYVQQEDQVDKINTSAKI